MDVIGIKDGIRVSAQQNIRENFLYITYRYIRYKMPYMIDENRSISIIPSKTMNIEKSFECCLAPVIDSIRAPFIIKTK